MLQHLTTHAHPPRDSHTQAIKADEAEEAVKRMRENKYDFNDFLKQWKTVNNMGGMQARGRCVVLRCGAARLLIS